MTRGHLGRRLLSVTNTAGRPDVAPPAPPTPRGAIDISTPAQASSDSSIWTATRVIALALTVPAPERLARGASLPGRFVTVR
jgi:hypothetical protein